MPYASSLTCAVCFPIFYSFFFTLICLSSEKINDIKGFLFVADPWEHVLGMGIGAVLVKWDAQLQEDLDKMLEKAKAANERRYFGIPSFKFSFYC